MLFTIYVDPNDHFILTGVIITDKLKHIRVAVNDSDELTVLLGYFPVQINFAVRAVETTI